MCFTTIICSEDDEQASTISDGATRARSTSLLDRHECNGVIRESAGRKYYCIFSRHYVSFISASSNTRTMTQQTSPIVRSGYTPIHFRPPPTSPTSTSFLVCVFGAVAPLFTFFLSVFIDDNCKKEQSLFSLNNAIKA